MKSKFKVLLLYVALFAVIFFAVTVLFGNNTNAEKYRYDQVKELLTEKYVLYIVLKELEKSTGENWHLYAPLLQSDMFIQMLNASQEKMQNVVETPDGEFSLYGLKFTKS